MTDPIGGAGKRTPPQPKVLSGIGTGDTGLISNLCALRTRQASSKRSVDSNFLRTRHTSVAASTASADLDIVVQKTSPTPFWSFRRRDGRSLKTSTVARLSSGVCNER